MTTGKKEIPTSGTELKISRKIKIKKLAFWLLIDLSVASIVFALLLYKPRRYVPIELETDSENRGQVSTFLTHQLGPTVYNNVQLGEPFDAIITQDGANDIISRMNWPMESEGVLLYAPAALFVPETVVLMGTADVQGVRFIITIELEPKIDIKGLLNLQVLKVKVGAINITPLAKAIAKKMYAQKLAAFPVDTRSMQTKIVASLLNDEPFEPVFRLDDESVRIEKIAVENGKLTVHLVPY